MRPLKNLAPEDIVQSAAFKIAVQKEVKSNLGTIYKFAVPILSVAAFLFTVSLALFGIRSADDLKQIDEKIAATKKDLDDYKDQAHSNLDAVIAANESAKESLKASQQSSASWLGQESGLLERTSSQANDQYERMLNLQMVQSDQNALQKYRIAEGDKLAEALTEQSQKSAADTVKSIQRLDEETNALRKAEEEVGFQTNRLLDAQSVTVFLGSDTPKDVDLYTLGVPSKGGIPAEPIKYNFSVKTEKAKIDADFNITVTGPTGGGCHVYKIADPKQNNLNRIKNTPFGYSTEFVYQRKYGALGPHRFLVLRIIPMPGDFSAQVNLADDCHRK